MREKVFLPEQTGFRSSTVEYKESKNVPKIDNWPQFKGEGEYDHLEFIRAIELLKEDFELNDTSITSRLICIFKGAAKKWFNTIRITYG